MGCVPQLQTCGRNQGLSPAASERFSVPSPINPSESHVIDNTLMSIPSTLPYDPLQNRGDYLLQITPRVVKIMDHPIIDSRILP